MKCHEVDYEIIGDDLQFVEVDWIQAKRLSLKLGP